MGWVELCFLNVLSEAFEERGYLKERGVVRDWATGVHHLLYLSGIGVDLQELPELHAPSHYECRAE